MTKETPVFDQSSKTMENEVYSLCFMCSVRCPIRVSTKDGRVTWVQGNPHVAGIDGVLCPRGAAGIALLNDNERLQAPMIRMGPRGSGQWRKATWEEALDYTAEKLKAIIAQYGPESVAFGERANLNTHISKTFMRAIGSPNHYTHDALCKGSVNTACRSLFGYTDAQMSMHYPEARQIILYGRNMFESIAVKEVRNLAAALEKGCELTYIDPRVTVTATRAHRYWMIRPGTDLALNYALMHVIIEEKLYDAAFVKKWVHGFDELREFVRALTPEWAEAETGIPAARIVELARAAGRDKPAVIFHFGYRGAHHQNEIYLRRSILILNALMGSIETRGGVFFKKGPGEVGRKAARKLTEQAHVPKVDKIRFDKVGTPDFPLPDTAHGVAQMLPRAILDEDPYPIKALIVNRFEPLMSVPDTNLTLRAFEKLDFIAAIEINYSDTAWHADVILPESIYLERTDSVQQANGLKPQMFLRNQAVPPRYDTLESAVILKLLAARLGAGDYFPYDSMDELVPWQLDGTGFTRRDFETKGFVSYCQNPIWWDHEMELKFKTASGKVEFQSNLLEEAGYPSFPEYEPVPKPSGDQFRLTVGRIALHTHISTQNNQYLNEVVSKNVLWINEIRAAELGISDGDRVEVSSKAGSGEIEAKVTDSIHPDAVFMLHGFGHDVEYAGRSFKKGLSDALLQENLYDKIGGSPALHDTFVRVKRI